VVWALLVALVVFSVGKEGIGLDWMLTLVEIIEK
jgi:hypothetical protein